MNAPKKLALTVALGSLFFLGDTPHAEAVVRIYKVTISAKAVFFTANSFTRKGYLIYDDTGATVPQVVEVLPNRKYQVNGAGFLSLVSPSQIAFFPIDRNGDTVKETESALLGFQTGNTTEARAYGGAIPKFGFRIGNTTYVGFSKSLKGKGAVSVNNLDNFGRSDSFTIDTLMGANPVNTNAGVALVTAFLEGKNFDPI